MKPRYRAIKGTRDLLPPESERFAAIETLARWIFSSYGYGEIRTPTFEQTDLFERSVGETTDIVHKEMYTFTDRGHRSLTLRPENTAGVVRAVLQQASQDRSKIIRLWYAGPQFRYENPQSGRFREFRQIGAELIGVESAAGEAEVLKMLFTFLGSLGLTDLHARINYVPTGRAREAFSNALRAYLAPHASSLGPVDSRRLQENPLRLFDSKDPSLQQILWDAPKTLEFLDQEALTHYEDLKRLLAEARVPFAPDPTLVRGLDYYTLTVFEVTSTALGAQDALLGGGRYDNLFNEFGGPPTPAVGFAIGEDRLAAASRVDPRIPRPLAFVIPESRVEFDYALFVSHHVRQSCQGLTVETDLSGRGIKRGLAHAAEVLEDPYSYLHPVLDVFAILLGQRERQGQFVTLKFLKSGLQERVLLSEVVQHLVPNKL